ncbi:uncharacterized protein DUF4867 [Salsuginibacillus halophilus]|uniref:Uncharacterized protein DUF4867 n=1 Tax=Salsuginibacillus halophilus TaxID=517424 RepID=A0A2P8HKY7_9BACI|nr:DUF4867 family protein [Salsuginibacillus halophilus]PSL46885.1 uncharacterized protein DUF4867 [Salsuginibacillus halophilus]
MYDFVQQQNPHLNIRHVHDEAFQTYGVVRETSLLHNLPEVAMEMPIPESGNHYEASVASLEGGPWLEEMKYAHFGGMPIQIGYCNGWNDRLNGLEYHKGSELNYMLTDAVLFLSDLRNKTEEGVSVEHITPFFIPQGTFIELYQTTLHLAPCRVTAEPFRTIVILPLGTNTPLPNSFSKEGESKWLLEVNKWVLAHPDNERMLSRGARPGISGPNLQVDPVNISPEKGRIQ